MFIAIKPNKSARNAAAIKRELAKACQIKTTHLLTDHASYASKTSQDQSPWLAHARSEEPVLHDGRLTTAGSSPTVGTKDRQPTGQYEFDRLCEALGLGIVTQAQETLRPTAWSSAGRVSDILKTHHFLSGEDLEASSHRYVFLYDQQLPQPPALGGKTPLQAMQAWFKSNPDLFLRRPYNRLGFDTYNRMGCDTHGAVHARPQTEADIAAIREWQCLFSITIEMACGKGCLVRTGKVPSFGVSRQHRYGGSVISETSGLGGRRSVHAE